MFFDELGPPWPKHPCTDRSSDLLPYHHRADGTFFTRKSPAITEILKWHVDRGFHPDADFAKKHGSKPWKLTTIVLRIKRSKQVFLALKTIQQGQASDIYVSCKALPKCCTEGFVIAILKSKISFVDMADLTDKKVDIKRYRSAKAFFDAMTG